MFPIFEVVLLFSAALLAGALNSVAGGGSFISFPALLASGVPSIPANATNTMALWPGSVASVGAYRAELVRQNRAQVVFLALVSLIGGLLGAELLLRTPKETFERLIPWLLLLATLLFIYGGSATRWLREHLGRGHNSANNSVNQALPASPSKRALEGGGEAEARPPLLTLIGVGAIQLFIAIYGGYFGAGIGILMLAALSLTGMTNIHTMNALKTVLASCINGVAVVRFIIAGTIFWPEAVLMIVGAIIGGYGGAAIAQKLDPKLVRRFVIVVAVSMTLYFFVRG